MDEKRLKEMRAAAGRGWDETLEAPDLLALLDELEAARAVVEAADTVRMTAQSGPQPGSVTVPRSAMRELDRACRAHIDAAARGEKAGE